MSALRQAGVLIALGLIVQALTCLRLHPSSFLVFVVLGLTLVAAGIARYLMAVFSWVRRSTAPDS